MTRASLYVCDGDPEDYVSGHSAVITATGDSGKVTTVGRMRVTRVHAGLAANHGVSLFEVCDCDGDLHHLHTLLYRWDTYDFKRGVERRFEPFDSDLLVVEDLVIAPRWRGLRLGLLAVRKVIDLVGGGCGLTVAHVAPMTAETAGCLQVPKGWVPPHPTAGSRREGATSLRRYFRQMGFERLGRTPWYGLSMTKSTPKGSELLGQRAEAE